jgi:hypothetical protein
MGLRASRGASGFRKKPKASRSKMAITVKGSRNKTPPSIVVLINFTMATWSSDIGK